MINHTPAYWAGESGAEDGVWTVMLANGLVPTSDAALGWGAGLAGARGSPNRPVFPAGALEAVAGAAD